MGLYALMFALAGLLCVYALAQSVYRVGTDDLVTAAGAFAAETAPALLAFVLPGGLVAREAGIAMALAPAMPAAPALAVAVLARIGRLALDLILAVVTRALARRRELSAGYISVSVRRNITFTLVFLVVLVAGVGLLAALGGDEDTTSQSSTTDQPELKAIGPPPEKETFSEAKKRITKALDSGDCDAINEELNMVGIPGPGAKARCQAYEAQLAGLPISGADSYGDLGAVIDYENESVDRTMSLVLVRDVDGRFHTAYIDPWHASPSVGTEPNSSADKVADAAFKAIRDDDCDGFHEVANRFVGPGTSSRSDVCEYVKGIAGFLKSFPDAKLKSLGGNVFYSFYGLDTPAAYHTVIVARQEADELPDPVPEEISLPEDAPKYGWAAIYQTNTPEAATEPEAE